MARRTIPAFCGRLLALGGAALYLTPQPVLLQDEKAPYAHPKIEENPIFYTPAVLPDARYHVFLTLSIVSPLFLMYIEYMRFDLKKVLTFIAGVLVVGIILFYAYFQARTIIAGPQIMLVEPQNGITSEKSLVLVRGKATNAKELTLDGRQIFIDLEGNFAEQLLLATGYNIIELTAKDAQGRSIVKKLELVYLPVEKNITP